MAPVAPAAGQASNLLQKLSLDPQPKSKGGVEANKKVSPVHVESSNDDVSKVLVASEAPPVWSELTDSGNYYVPACYAPPAYFYGGGYNHAFKEWNGYSTYMNQDGMQGINAPWPTSRMRPTAPLVTSRMCGFGYGHSGMFMEGNYYPRGPGNTFFGTDHEFSELNRGPRAIRLKNQKVAGPAPMISSESQKLSSFGNENSGAPLDREQYNQQDFPDKYSNAKFFIIKSYSEDDIHKSMKYNVWSSTPNGNKKLDAGYQEAQEKTGDCPVFLFFSVNASGQFIGVAEMVGRVNFNKTVDYWQQNKWVGCFPVKWHIIKDVPNSILKHVTLENNENKPVTNSRDTQEVEPEQGLQMLKIFKEHINNTSILDDFDFYEHRQRSMQEKRAKQQLQKQDWDGKTSRLHVEGEKVVGKEIKLQPDAGDSVKITKGAANGDANGF